MQTIVDFVSAIVKSMSPLEMFGAVTGLLAVYLTVRNNIWYWFWGTLSVIAYGWIFWEAKLYSNMGLQLLYFLPMQAYGWWSWKYGGNAAQEELTISRLPVSGWIIGLAFSAAFALGWGRAMAGIGASLPYADALVTGLSLVGQYLQARRMVENWHFWVMVNIVSTFYLFPMQKLYVTTGLYGIFLILAVMGLVEWRKIWLNQQAALTDSSG